MCCHLDMKFHSIWTILLYIFPSYILTCVAIYEPYFYPSWMLYKSGIAFDRSVGWWRHRRGRIEAEGNSTNLIWFPFLNLYSSFWLHTHHTPHIIQFTMLLVLLSIQCYFDQHIYILAVQRGKKNGSIFSIYSLVRFHRNLSLFIH